MEVGKGPLPKEAELQKGVEQARVTQTLVDRRGDSQVEAPTWAVALVLDEAPLLANALIRNFQ